ncbi:MAG: Crp/Fnr family transcriptional regulator [Bacteroidota bacterium]
MQFDLLISAIKKGVAFDQAGFDAITARLKLVKLDKLEVWQESGRVTAQMAFIQSGILRQFYQKDEKEFTELFYEPGVFIGNHLSYLNKTPSPYAIQALVPSELYVLPFAELESFFPDFPVIEAYSEYVSEQKVLEMNDRLVSRIQDSPEERYAQLLRNQPDVVARIPQYYIAQYLGMRPESLSRLRKRSH